MPPGPIWSLAENENLANFSARYPNATLGQRAAYMSSLPGASRNYVSANINTHSRSGAYQRAYANPSTNMPPLQMGNAFGGGPRLGTLYPSFGLSFGPGNPFGR